MSKAQQGYVTTRDIVIPAGTVLHEPCLFASHWRDNHEAVIGHGRDHSSYWSVNLQDALRLGLVEEVKA